MNPILSIIFHILIVHASYGLWTVYGVDPLPVASINPSLAQRQEFIEPYGKGDPDEAATCGQLIESRGFKFERYYVTTADGYILQNYRIINPYAIESGKTLKPVLLIHGTCGSCATWLLSSPGGHIKPWINGNPPNDTSNSVAFLLANLGYDVWLMNVRGNTYSTNHTYLDTEGSEFWKYSYYEVGIYDVTATVEHIKNETGFEKIKVVSHSQGAVQLIVQLSVMPEFQENYEVIVLAAPITFLGDVKGLMGALITNPHISDLLSQNNGPTPPEIFGPLTVLCRNPIAIPMCAGIMTGLGDFNREYQNLTRTSVYLSQFDRSSLRNAAHLYQSLSKGRLVYFDYGEAKNYEIYGSAEPPEFPYYKINPNKLVIISGLSDETADPPDMQRFRNSLCSRPCADHIVTDPSFNHLSFIESTRAYEYFGSVLVKLIEQCVDYGS